jgi:hypothetical protein
MDHTPKFYDDDGNELNPNLYPVPLLCMSCKKKDDPEEEILCILNRLAQRSDRSFECGAYENMGNKM